MNRPLLALVAMGVVGLGAWRLLGGSRSEPTWPIPGDEITLEVEVLNGTTIDGLAGSVTRVLRRQGIDVVYVGSGGATDSTVIIVRRGDSSAAAPVRRALGLGHVRIMSDPQRLVDVTVLLGVDAAAIQRHP